MVNSYSKAGVDTKKAENALSSVKELVTGTYNKAVISPENGFASLYQINEGQVLAAATDGVGTKLDIAIEMKSHRGVGVDLVAMVVNDIAVYGIKPLFFLDYMATSKLKPEVFSEVVEGIVDGCRQAGCVLIGGETAEMPGFYPNSKYDLAGFAVGLAEKKDLITGENIKPGDIVLGLSSSGLHSNGFSLVRKIIKDNDILLSQDFEGKKLGEVLLEPTVIYSELVQDLKDKAEVKGFAHITGGGFSNIERILPSGTKVIINKGGWEKPAIFSFIQEKGEVDSNEMFDIFNMGIGMVAIVDKSQVQAIKEVSSSHKIAAFEIGKIEKGNKEVVIE
ncbi:MAG: phosphoribosylformylglycinamidine cyclo-ligase [Actinobacteria bacterium]|nr:MAG: phosphoribosylformylglycinamidine cyclo-ligase [Actinomycetota bacterium]